MKVLMLGWEFPPFFAGGLGIVCYELTKVLSTYSDIQITYMMPFGPEGLSSQHVNLIAAKKKLPRLNIKEISTILQAYMGEKEYKQKYLEVSKGDDPSKVNLYGSNLYEEIEFFSNRALAIASEIEFDVIHAHDYHTFPAAVKIAKAFSKPLILHIHNTVYDRYLSEVPYEKEIELYGFNHATKIIAISNYIREKVVNNYGIDSNKIVVIHNGGISDLEASKVSKYKSNDKVVLFAGRITAQKGPEYFIRAAQKVLKKDPSVKFIVAGDGDMLYKIKDLAKELDIFDKIYFHGRYSREDADKFFSIADVFVMPSVSEPFGLVPLEAIAKGGTPTIISKQSGISEVLENTFKIDFWDIDEMANKILGVLKYEVLNKTLKEKSFDEFKKFGWDRPAKKVYDLYKEVIY